ncbi:hypothetical protein NKI09_15200 [Mesorhizobium sp. M0757]|uniref:hypothetical protein n=1 Tax=Mesorhizobium sp. M0757 TaxID=2956993 RepID=UPI003334E3E2
MPVRKRTDRRRDGVPVEALRRVWELWRQPKLTLREQAEMERLTDECEAAGYDPLLAWC